MSQSDRAQHSMRSGTIVSRMSCAVHQISFTEISCTRSLLSSIPVFELRSTSIGVLTFNCGPRTQEDHNVLQMLFLTLFVCNYFGLRLCATISSRCVSETFSRFSSTTEWYDLEAGSEFLQNFEIVILVKATERLVTRKIRSSFSYLGRNTLFIPSAKHVALR